jgi:hypothetical protein
MSLSGALYLEGLQRALRVDRVDRVDRVEAPRYG